MAAPDRGERFPCASGRCSVQDEIGLADALRERTRALHGRAERSGVIRDIVRGRAHRHTYALFLRNLLPVYAALETGIGHHRCTPGIRCLHQPAVFRVQALQSDLMALYPAGWERVLGLCGAARRYARRVGRAAEGNGAGLIAHAYVRYLGDLNGGAILRRRLAESLGLEGSALSFYDYPQVPDLALFSADYRRAVDRAGVECGSREAVLAEVALAFELNIELSEAVAAAAAAGVPP